MNMETRDLIIIIRQIYFDVNFSKIDLDFQRTCYAKVVL